MSNLFRARLAKVPDDTRIWVSKSFDITDQILDILERKSMTQKQLAELLGKRESEVSKWMKGTHNFTEETIAKIEIALGEPITMTVKQSALQIIALKEEIAAQQQKIKTIEAFLKNKGFEPGEYSWAMAV